MNILALSSLPVLAALLASLSPAQAGGAEPRRSRVVVVPRLPFSVHDAVVEHDKVVVKFREGIRVRLRGGSLTSPDGADLGSVARVLAGTRIERLFTRPVDELDRERAELQTRLAPDEDPLADLNNYYRVHTSGARETERLVNQLNTDPLVETAYAEFVPIPVVDIPPPTPNFESSQTYLNPAPAGLHYKAYQSIVGARFPDGQLAHLEGSWVIGHEDCDWLATSSYLGSPPGPSYNNTTWSYHGTACVGIMAAGRNEYGVRGIACDTRKLYLVSLTNGSSNMVNITAARLQPGDVMSSSFAFGIVYQGQTVQAPRDFPQGDFDAIRAAAARGIHYTFAAGNSGWDLEDTQVFGNRYQPTALSSGGYIIGGTPPGATTRINFSNYGNVHVIANGWADRVTTLGYGDLFNPNDPLQHYTAQFGGTSAAAPQVAGIIAAYAGAVQEQMGRVLTVNEVKNDLRSTGTVVSGTIGNRPDFRQLLALHNLPDGTLVTVDGTPGGVFAYQVTGNTGEPFIVMLSGGRGRVPIGFNRPVLVDLSVMGVLASGSLPASIVNTFVPVPNNPAFKGVDLYLQSVFVRSGTLYLSNSATLWIR